MIHTAKSQTTDLVVPSTNTQLNGNYTPQGTNKGKTYWLGPNPSMPTYVIYYDGAVWNFAYWMGSFNNWMVSVYKLNSSVDVPIGIWSTGFEVKIRAPEINYSSDVLNESNSNNGSFSF